MKTFSPLLRLGALCVLALVLLVGRGQVGAQTNAELTASELMKLNLHLQEQLHEAKLAIERNRQEAQEAARVQAAAITETLNSIQGALEAERQRRQDESQRATRTLLWVAASFGGVGLLAMLLTALFQYRAMNRMAEISVSHPQLTSSSGAQALLPADTAGLPTKAVEVSNQRLLSVIDRLERRVLELEHTAARPGASPTIEVTEATEGSSTASRISELLARGQTLLNADKATEALACYDEVLGVQADHSEALVKKGAALERLKQDEEALRCYDRAIAADGTLTIAYLYKGGIYNRLERYNEALECYEQALRVQGGSR
jgi:tetratricopeptide (TPR) repeat protein